MTDGIRPGTYIPKPPYELLGKWDPRIIAAPLEFYEVHTTDRNALERVAMFKCEYHAELFIAAPETAEELEGVKSALRDCDTHLKQAGNTIVTQEIEIDTLKAQNAQMLAALELVKARSDCEDVPKTTFNIVARAIANAKGDSQPCSTKSTDLKTGPE